MQSSQLSREIEGLIEDVVQQLEDAIEAATLVRARALTEEYLRNMEPRQRPRATTAAAPPPTPRPVDAARPPAPRRRRPAKAVIAAKAPPPVDPESERRAAELARLRSILRPMAPTPAPIVAPLPVPVREPGPDDSLQALEDRIRDEIPALSGLSQGRCTARIASWVGRVRLHQSGPDAERTRIASRMLLDKLRNLAWSMDAGKIEGLDLSWSTRNWQRYIDACELIAATPDAAPAPAERQEASSPSSESSDSSESSESSDDPDVWATPAS
jgi:hypothetical protein